MTKEERAALILGGRGVIQVEIARLTLLRQSMMGTLYPSILGADIAALQTLLYQMPKERSPR